MLGGYGLRAGTGTGGTHLTDVVQAAVQGHLLEGVLLLTLAQAGLAT